MTEKKPSIWDNWRDNAAITAAHITSEDLSRAAGFPIILRHLDELPYPYRWQDRSAPDIIKARADAMLAELPPEAALSARERSYLHKHAGTAWGPIALVNLRQQSVGTPSLFPRRLTNGALKPSFAVILGSHRDTSELTEWGWFSGLFRMAEAAPKDSDVRLFFILHELGHALQHRGHAPSLARENDWVYECDADRFALLRLVEGGHSDALRRGVMLARAIASYLTPDLNLAHDTALVLDAVRRGQPVPSHEEAWLARYELLFRTAHARHGQPPSMTSEAIREKGRAVYRDEKQLHDKRLHESFACTAPLAQAEIATRLAALHHVMQSGLVTDPHAARLGALALEAMGVFAPSYRPASIPEKPRRIKAPGTSRAAPAPGPRAA